MPGITSSMFEEMGLTPLYILFALAALIILAMMVSVLRGSGARLRGEPFQRQALLSVDEQRCYQMLVTAVGDAYRVCPKIAALALLRPLPGIGRKQRRLVLELLAEGWADLLICTALDLHPLALVRLVPAKSGRAQRRRAARLQAAFVAAGMPVIEIMTNDLPSAERLRELVDEAIALADLPVAAHRLQAGAELSRGDEEALLSELAAAMRDPEDADGR